MNRYIEKCNRLKQHLNEHSRDWQSVCALYVNISNLIMRDIKLREIERVKKYRKAVKEDAERKSK